MTYLCSQFQRRAFSLVELSIVLVILGLLVGGILSGRSLIRASELRAITTERDRFATAFSTFRDKYFQLPGDLSNAYQFWGAACGTNTTTASTGCNGNGNGIIGSDTNGENVKVWEHLARAGLIEGSYDGVGVDNGVGQMMLAKNNIPASKFPSHYWAVNSGDYPGLSSNDVALTTGALGSDIIIDYSPTLTRAEAWGVDKKVDDGKANSGKVRGDARVDCNDTPTGYGDYGANAAMGGDPNTADCTLTFILN